MAKKQKSLKMERWQQKKACAARARPLECDGPRDAVAKEAAVVKAALEAARRRSSKFAVVAGAISEN